ncbi:myosin-binding striated muscle assembly central-domain-containing protein [Geopyxis carbonaria]|nr:myosin-binding striated muscle assembly central-domain-containing protein [Geopyxis carbonaria]
MPPDTSPDADADARAAALATESLVLYKDNKQDDAARTLREALALSPRNPTVLNAFTTLRTSASIPAPSKLAHRFTLDGDVAAGTEAVALLSDPGAPPLDSEAAVGIVTLLLAHVGQLPDVTIGGQLLAATLAGAKAARERVAAEMAAGAAAAVVKRAETLGPAAVDAVVQVVLEKDVWTSVPRAEQGARTAFKVLLGRVGTPAARDYAVRSVARLLAGAAPAVAAAVDQAGLESLLALLRPGTPAETRSHATLAVAKFVEARGDVAQSMVGTFMAARLSADGDDDLALAFAVAAALFPLVPQTAAALFLSGGFVEGLVPMLQARPVEVEEAALEMVSAACIDAACREQVAAHCREFLQSVVKRGDSGEGGRTTAAVVLAKLQYGIAPAPGKTKADAGDIDTLSAVFKNLMATPDATSRESAVEGLAYTSLTGSVKDAITADASVLAGLISTLASSAGNPTLMFGALTVLQNLTAYLPVLSAEQQKMAQLKSYAEAKGAAAPAAAADPADSDPRVTQRCKALITAGVVPALSAACAKPTPAAVGIVSTILLALSSAQPHRGALAAAGAVKLLLTLHAAPANPAPPTTAHALARILVSVNPSHTFSSHLPISAAVRPLASLLTGAADAPSLLPAWEALLALTNLASVDGATRALVLRAAWPPAEELLLSENARLQRAACELLCNLALAPECAARYGDGSRAAAQRVHVLLALADAEARETRLAAGGALASMTGYAGVAEAVLRREGGVQRVLGMVREGGGMAVRGVVVVRNLCEIEGAGARLVGEGAVEVVAAAVQEAVGGSAVEARQVVEIGMETVKVLVGSY